MTKPLPSRTPNGPPRLLLVPRSSEQGSSCWWWSWCVLKNVRKKIVLNTPSDCTQTSDCMQTTFDSVFQRSDRLQVVLHSFAIPVQKLMQLICCHWLLSPQVDYHGLPMSVDVCSLQLMKFVDTQRVKHFHHVPCVNPLCQRHLRTPVWHKRKLHRNSSSKHENQYLHAVQWNSTHKCDLQSAERVTSHHKSVMQRPIQSTNHTFLHQCQE